MKMINLTNRFPTNYLSFEKYLQLKTIATETNSGIPVISAL